MKNTLIIFSFILISLNAFSHSGRTDKKGGHNDRINGGYHYHHGKRAHQHPNGVCELSSKYKRTAYSKNNKTSESKEESNWGELLLVGVLGSGVGYFFRNRNKE